MLTRRIAGELWRLSSRRHHRKHCCAWRHVRRHAERRLLTLLRANALTAYGRAHGYGSITSIAAFQERVPVVDYEQLEPWITRILHGEEGVLTAEPVLAFERSSGSSSAAKYIPYTASLLDEFQSAVGAWMYDLLTRRPRLRGGAHYWQISPMARVHEVTPGGLPVGFSTDAGYLAPRDQKFLSRLQAVPGSVAATQDLEACRRETLDHLMKCRDLRFISVWSPSFLTLLLDRLPTGAAPLDLWPELEVVSCWTSASSARFVPELERRLPGVEIQGKGLLATEGVVSFPVIGSPGPVPAITAHFLEFLDSDGVPHLADDLEVGGCYRVVITTGGGLTRYDLGDLVEVVAHGAIEFVGKAGTVSDLCGEKLSADRIDRVVSEACTRHGHDGFAMLAPELGEPPHDAAHYVLFLDRPAAPGLVESIENALRQGSDYDYCRRLGQLGSLRSAVVPNVDERFLDGCVALGQRAGDVKSTYLRKETGWCERMGVVA